MPVPPDPVLLAAARWLDHLETSDVMHARALFTSHRDYADVTPTQYATALGWLREKGLIVGDGLASNAAVGPSSLIEMAFLDALWFPDADLLLTGTTELPDDLLRAASTLGLEPAEALAAVRHSWGKVDTAARLRVGSAGELALLALLTEATDLPVHHVAAVSDGYGYDIALGQTHIEVKSTTRRGRLTIHLSRNEYETMKHDPGWLLALVRLDHELRPAAVATLDRDWIDRTVPVDSHHHGRWESVRLDVPSDAVLPGISAISGLTRPLAKALLAGVPVWPG